MVNSKEMIFDFENLISKKLTTTDLGLGSPILGDCINESKKLKVIIRATKQFKKDYNGSRNPFIKSFKDEIALAINEVKNSPIPLETNDWKTLKEFRIKNQNNSRIAALMVGKTSYRLVYVYSLHKQIINNAEYDVVRVILINVGHYEVFNFYYEYSKMFQSNYLKNQFKGEKQKMNLELNLVKTRSTYTKMCSLIARKRVIVEDGSDAMDAIIAFIIDNSTTFGAAIKDESLTDKLGNLQTLTVDELYSLKYIISEYGVDLIITVVSDAEINQYGIPSEEVEYNIIDNFNSPLSFVKFATKLSMSPNGFLTELYTKITKMYGLFEGNLFVDYKNPFSIQLDILRRNEEALGITPAVITTYLNNVLEYMGKDIYVIMP